LGEFCFVRTDHFTKGAECIEFAPDPCSSFMSPILNAAQRIPAGMASSSSTSSSSTTSASGPGICQISCTISVRLLGSPRAIAPQAETPSRGRPFRAPAAAPLRSQSPRALSQSVGSLPRGVRVRTHIRLTRVRRRFVLHLSATWGTGALLYSL
jgi:hypothetical protein